MDQQEIDVRQFQVRQTLVDHLDEICGPQMLLPHLGADEYPFAFDSRLAQPLAVFFFVSIEGRGVEVVIADLQRRLDCLYADVVLQGHSAKTDDRDTSTMGFDDFHYFLLGTALDGVTAGPGRMPGRHGAANRSSATPMRTT